MNPHNFQRPTLHGIELLSRRRLPRRALLSAAGLPFLGTTLFWPGRLLAATEESPETENNWEGPFCKPGAPVRSVLLEKGMGGTPLTVVGRVLDTRGRALKGALLDLWHADRTGTYDNKGFTPRGKLYTGDEGRHTLRTIKPLCYGDANDKRPSAVDGSCVGRPHEHREGAAEAWRKRQPDGQRTPVSADARGVRRTSGCREAAESSGPMKATLALSFHVRTAECLCALVRGHKPNTPSQ